LAGAIARCVLKLKNTFDGDETTTGAEQISSH